MPRAAQSSSARHLYKNIFYAIRFPGVRRKATLGCILWGNGPFLVAAPIDSPLFYPQLGRRRTFVANFCLSRKIAIFHARNLMKIALCPAQQKACDQILKVLPALPVIGLTVASGSGGKPPFSAKGSRTNRRRGGFRGERVARRTQAVAPVGHRRNLRTHRRAALKESEYVFLDDLSKLTTVVLGRANLRLPTRRLPD